MHERLSTGEHREENAVARGALQHAAAGVARVLEVRRQAERARCDKNKAHIELQCESSTAITMIAEIGEHRSGMWCGAHPSSPS